MGMTLLGQNFLRALMRAIWPISLCCPDGQLTITSLGSRRCPRSVSLEWDSANLLRGESNDSTRANPKHRGRNWGIVCCLSMVLWLRHDVCGGGEVCRMENASYQENSGRTLRFIHFAGTRQEALLSGI